MFMAGRGMQVEADVGNQRWLASGAGTHASFSRQNSSGSLMVGGNYRVGKKIGSGNFGELRLGMCPDLSVYPIWCVSFALVEYSVVTSYQLTD